MENVIVQYVVRGNTDTTEGRGGTVDREKFVKVEDAYECATSGKHGVMGTTSGVDIVERRMFVDETGRKWQTEDVLLWGYHRNKLGKYVQGWTDDRDLPTDDPEFEQYLRLKKKFEKG